MVLIALGGLIGYLLGAFVLFALFRKAGYRFCLFAFFPILNLIGILHIIDRSGWNVLWTFVPIANLVFGILWGIDFLKVYGMNPWWLAMLVLPYVGALGFFVLNLYMATARDVTYDAGRIGRIQV